jgi:hypothetical protein
LPNTAVTQIKLPGPCFINITINPTNTHFPSTKYFAFHDFQIAVSFSLISRNCFLFAKEAVVTTARNLNFEYHSFALRLVISSPHIARALPSSYQQHVNHHAEETSHWDCWVQQSDGN